MRTTAYPNKRKFATAIIRRLISSGVANGIKRLTIEVPEELHDAFQRRCFLAKPRVTMRERILEFIAKDVGMPVPKLVDRRKLTLDERAKLKAEEKRER